MLTRGSDLFDEFVLNELHSNRQLDIRVLIHIKFISKLVYLLNILNNINKPMHYNKQLNYINLFCYSRLVVNNQSHTYKMLNLLDTSKNISKYANYMFIDRLIYHSHIFFFMKNLNIWEVLNSYNNLFIKRYSNYTIFNIIAKLSIESSIELKKYWDDRMGTLLTLRKPICSNESLLLYRIAILDIILKRYLESCLSSKIFLNFDKYNIMFFRVKNNSFYHFKKKLKRMKRVLKGNKITLKTFINIFMVFIFTKDIDLIFRMLTDVLQNMSFKNHKRFLYYLKLFVTRTLLKYYRSSKFLGFYFYISGKISCTGNSKTRKYIISYRKHSFSNKTLKIKLKKGLVYTRTGVLGFTLIISYR